MYRTYRLTVIICSVGEVAPKFTFIAANQSAEIVVTRVTKDETSSTLELTFGPAPTMANSNATAEEAINRLFKIIHHLDFIFLCCSSNKRA